MRQYSFMILSICLVVFTSCKNEQELEAEAKKMANERFGKLNMQTLDTYPLFEGCEALENSKDCFYEQLNKLLLERLDAKSIGFTVSPLDSMLISMSVDDRGFLKYERIISLPDSLNVKRVDSVLQARLQYLPRLSSALKQDVPVKSAYKIPIVLKQTDSLL